MDYQFLYFISIFVICFWLFAIFVIGDKRCHLNSNYKGNHKDFELELKVDKIERTYTKDSGIMPCAKYTLDVFYLYNKNKVKHSTVIMYDEMDKYHVGDILTLSLKEKPSH